MNKKNRAKKLILGAGILCLPFFGFSQAGDTSKIETPTPPEGSILDDLIDDEEQTIYTESPFKANRIISGQSIAMLAPGVLDYRIHHRFGEINGGFYELFGLDNANTRNIFDYGVSKNLTLGIGRSGSVKQLGGYAKYRLLRQSTGKVEMPITLIAHTYMGYDFRRLPNPERNKEIVPRISYTTQLLIGRKFSRKFSAQLSPTWVHRNMTRLKGENDVFAIGSGARLGVSNRVSINFEHFYVIPNVGERTYVLPDGTLKNFKNNVSLGVDIETGGHVFQLHVSSSRFMEEENFIARNVNDPFKGEVNLGFNISRAFTLSRKARI